MAEELVTPAEPTQGTEGGAEGAQKPEVEVRPEYLDARFKSVEDQAKAYKEAESKMQREAQARAELERQHRELLARTQAPPAPPAPEPNYDELFWQKPTEVINTLLGKQVQAAVQPFVEQGYQAQKAAYANDPEFKKYEPLIDQLAAAQPQLKFKNGVVGELFRVARAMDFNPDEERRRIEDQVRLQLQQKVATSVEGAGDVADMKPTQKVELSAEEQAVARKLYDDIPPQQAYKKYHDSKMLMTGGN